MKKTPIVEPPGTGLRRMLGASLIAPALLLGANAAAAVPACASYETMSKQLELRHAEVPVAAGLEQSGKLLQVFAAEDGSSWTVVLIRPDGMSCIIAAGRYWETVLPKKQAPAV